jgi:LysM repeat protein
MIKYSIYIITACALTSCTSQLAMLQKDKYDTTIALDEMRIELSDLKHTLNNTQVEMQIIEEKIRAQDVTQSLNKSQNTSSALTSDIKIATLEKRISQIENMHERITAEIKQLSIHANQSTISFSQYQNRIKEIELELANQNKVVQELSDIKSTFKSFANNLKNRNIPSTKSCETYKVRSGDTLEKIARVYKTSVDAILKENNMSSTKIVIGQEIKVPNGTS